MHKEPGSRFTLLGARTGVKPFPRVFLLFPILLLTTGMTRAAENLHTNAVAASAARMELGSAAASWRALACALTCIVLVLRWMLSVRRAKQSEERSRSIAQATEDAIWDRDLRTQRVWCNRRFYDWFGCPSRPHHSWWQSAVHPDDRDRVQDSLERAFAARVTSWVGEYRLRKADCTYAHVRDRASIQYAISGRPIRILGGMSIIADRDLSKEALQDGEERDRLLFENNPLPMWVFDVETFVVLEGNHAAVEKYGYSREELSRMTICDLCWPEDVPQLTDNLRSWQSGEPAPAEFRHKKKDGSTIYVEITSFRLARAGGTLALIQANDVTRRKCSDLARRKSEADFRTILDNAMDLIVMADKDSTILYASRSTKQVLGYDAATMVGTRALDLIHLDDRPKASEALRRAFQEPGTAQREEFRMRCLDGSWRIIESLGSVVVDSAYAATIIVIGRDTTERRKAEEALQESQARYRHLIETAEEGIWTINSEGRTEFVNAKMAAMLGYSTEEMLGKSPLEFMDQQTAAEGAKILERRGSGTAQQMDWKYRHKGGEEVWVHESIRPIIDAHGNYVGDLAMMSDITDRKRGELALRDSEARFRQIFECNMMGILVGDSTGQVQDANDAALGFIGHTRLDFQAGRVNWRALSAPEYASQDQEWLDRFRATGNFGPFEKQFIRKDGSRVTLMVAGTKLGSDTDRAVAFWLDVSALKAAEAAARTNAERFYLLAEATNDAVWDWDICNKSIWHNKAHFDLFGHAFGELSESSNTWFAYIHPEDKERVVAGFWAAVNNQQQLWSDEFRFQRADGSYAFVLDRGYIVRDHHGRPVRMVGAMMDISERQRTHQELQESEANFRSLVENAPHGIYRSTLAGQFVSVNPALVEMLGYVSAEELMSVDISAGVYADPKQRTQALHLVQREGCARVEVVWKRKDGRPLTVILSARAIDASGHFEVMAVDVTKERQLEQQLRQAQKLEALGALTGGIAHDFNNIVMIVNAYSEALLDSLPPDSGLRPKIEQIQRAGGRAASLTRQLLAFSRKQVLSPTVLDLNAVLGELQHMLKRLIGEDVSLNTVLTDGLWNIRADQSQIEQVILNLAVNARDAMARGGRLTFVTENVVPDQSLIRAHPGAKDGEYVLLQVEDTGCGMTPEIQARIFDPFFTTKERGKGTGLGLSTVYGIVQQSEGYITVSSWPGRGTTFCVYLPRVMQDTAPAARSEPVDCGSGAATVLLVEDEQATREAMCSYLEQKGFVVVSAENAAAALQWCRGNRQRQLDVLVTDVIMPGMRGTDLARQMRSLYPSIRVIFMSGYTNSSLIEDDVLSSGRHFLQKPFSISVLANVISTVLKENRNASSPPTCTTQRDS